MNLQDLDLNVLLALHQLLQQRSVTKAAIQLGKTQSALSHTLNRLRDMFDDELLVRSGSQMMLTPRAQDLKVKLQEAISQLEQVIAPPKDFDPGRLSYEFHIVTTDWAEAILLPKMLEFLAIRAPKVRLKCSNQARVGESAIQDGRADLMLGVYHTELSGLVRQKIYDDVFVCMVSAKHFTHNHLDLETYIKCQHIGMTTDTYDWAEQYLRGQHIKRDIVMTLPHVGTAPLIVAQSPYILTLPKRLAQTFACMGLPIKLHELPIEAPKWTMSLLFHQNRKKDPAHIWLRGLIQEVGAHPLLDPCTVELS